MKKYKNANCTMESENHFKNGMSLKSQTSRENRLMSETGADGKQK